MNVLEIWAENHLTPKQAKMVGELGFDHWIVSHCIILLDNVMLFQSWGTCIGKSQTMNCIIENPFSDGHSLMLLDAETLAGLGFSQYGLTPSQKRILCINSQVEIFRSWIDDFPAKLVEEKLWCVPRRGMVHEIERLKDHDATWDVCTIYSWSTIKLSLLLPLPFAIIIQLAVSILVLDSIC